jgi:AcrR family transcriptional regulator
MAAHRKKGTRLGSGPTKAALLDAARWLLAQRGYEYTGTRAIAALAGVDQVLVRRYFGSKQGMCEAAIRGAFDATPVLAESGSPLAARLARTVLEPTNERPAFKPALLAARSAATPEIQKGLALGIEREFLTPLAEALEATGRKGARPRATAALAILTGFEMVHTVLGIELLQKPQGRALLLDLLRLCLDE